MRSQRSFPTLMLALLIAGCSANDGATLVTYTLNAQPRPLAKAPQDGQYALYSLTDVTPKVIYPLHKGDPLGFVEKGGQIVAVAGSSEVPIHTTDLIRSYDWRLLKR